MEDTLFPEGLLLGVGWAAFQQQTRPLSSCPPSSRSRGLGASCPVALLHDAPALHSWDMGPLLPLHVALASLRARDPRGEATVVFMTSSQR